MSTKTLPFVRHLRERVMGYAAPKPLRPSLRFCEVIASEEDLQLTKEVILRVEARVFYEERVKQSRLRTSSAEADRFRAGLKARAVEGIALELYGPIEHEIRHIQKLLWEEGLSNSEAAKRLGALIPLLRGEEARDDEGEIKCQ